MTPVRVIKSATRIVRAGGDASEKWNEGKRRAAVGIMVTAVVTSLLSLGLYLPDWLAQLVAEEGVEGTVALGMELWDGLIALFPVLAAAGGGIATRAMASRGAYDATDVIHDRDDSFFEFDAVFEDGTPGVRKLSHKRAMEILRRAVNGGEGF